MPRAKIQEIDASWDTQKISTFMYQDKKRIEKCKADIKLYESRIAQGEAILLARKMNRLEEKAMKALDLVWESVSAAGHEGAARVKEFTSLAEQSGLDNELIKKFIASKK